jgi:hypothetical protein
MPDGAVIFVAVRAKHVRGECAVEASAECCEFAEAAVVTSCRDKLRGLEGVSFGLCA